jgi:aspartate racemase
VRRSLSSAACHGDGAPVVVGVPCNTFHSPLLWSAFKEAVHRIDGVVLVNMVEETVKHVRQHLPHVRNVGLLTTTGTLQTRVYHDELELHGLKAVVVPDNIQADLQETIFNEDWGLKPGSSAKARTRMRRYARLLVNAGCGAVILGCSEIPLALPESRLNGVPLINPVVLLSRALIKAVAPRKLRGPAGPSTNTRTAQPSQVYSRQRRTARGGAGSLKS